MAATWTISHPERLVVVVGRDEVTFADFLYCADQLTNAGANPYRKIFDLTRIARAMLQADIQLLGKRMAAVADSNRFGPIAIVVASGAMAGSAKIYEVTAAAKRPIRIFRDLYSARAWLDEIAPPDQVPEAPHQ